MSGPEQWPPFYGEYSPDEVDAETVRQKALAEREEKLSKMTRSEREDFLRQEKEAADAFNNRPNA